jgi:hypothetical protein
VIIKKEDVTAKTVILAIDSTDHITPKTGLTITSVYYSLNGGTATVMTTPTVDELDATNMPGIYSILIDEAAMTAAEGELVITVSATGMDDVSKAIDIKTNTEGDVITALAVVDTNVDSILEDTNSTIPDTITTLTSNVATVDTNVDSILEDTNTTIPDTITTMQGNVTDILEDTNATLVAQITALENISEAEVNTQVAAALVTIHLDHLLAADTGASLPGAVGSVLHDLLVDDAGTWQYSTNSLANAPLGEGVTAAVIADAVWDEAISGHTTSNTFGGKNQKLIPSETIGDYTGDVSALTAAIATIDGIVDSIVADTAEMQTDLANGGRLDLLIDAIKAKTDNLKDTWNDLTAAQVNTEVDTGLSDYDAPTKAELDSGFAGLNDLTAAEVNAEVDTALGDYDSPTNTEMVAAFTEIKGAGWTDETLKDIRDNVAGSAPSAAVIADAVWDELIAGHVTAGTFGVKNQKVVPSETIGDYKADVSVLEGRLTAARAGYLDELGAANLPADIDLILEDTETTIPGTITTLTTNVATVDGIVDSIVADTAELQGDWVNGGRLDLILDIIAADTTTDIPATLSTIEGKIDGIDTDVTAVLVDTGTDIPAAISGLDTKIDTIDSNVDLVLVDTGTSIPETLTTMTAAIAVIDDIVDSVLEDTETDLPATLTTILADTNEVQADLADGGRTDLLIDNITSAIAALNDLGQSEMNSAVATAVAAAGLVTTTTVVDGTITYAQLFKTLLAQAAGLTAGGDTSTLIFYGQDDTTAVLTLTLDDENDRTAVVFDFS